MEAASAQLLGCARVQKLIAPSRNCIISLGRLVGRGQVLIISLSQSSLPRHGLVNVISKGKRVRMLPVGAAWMGDVFVWS